MGLSNIKVHNNFSSDLINNNLSNIKAIEKEFNKLIKTYPILENKVHKYEKIGNGYINKDIFLKLYDLKKKNFLIS